MPYVIRNCPAIFYSGITDEAKCWQKWEQFDESCQNCTDCVLKRIVELCKQRIVKYQNKDFFKYEDARILNGEAIMSRLILELLDIQEVE